MKRYVYLSVTMFVALALGACPSTTGTVTTGGGNGGNGSSGGSGGGEGGEGGEGGNAGRPELGDGEFTVSEIKAAKAPKYLPGVDEEALSACLRIGHLIAQMHADWGRFVEKHGLSASRYGVLVSLFHHPERAMTPAELAEEVGLSRGAMTTSLDGIEKLGYIRRARHPGDRRMVSVQLTREGAEFMERTLPDHYSLFGEVIRNLTRAEQENMVRLSEKLADSVRTVLEEAQ